MQSVRQGKLSVDRLYRRLAKHFGPQRWWPAKSPFEMMAGAILTQATRWHNAEQALARLEQARLLEPRRLAKTPESRLARLVRPSGFFRQKAHRLRSFTRWYVDRYGADPDRLFSQPWEKVRNELLALPGIGEETADAMLLYAGHRPAVVVDGYTVRIFRRHGLIARNASYAQVQRRIRGEMPNASADYGELHALIVALGKGFCHRKEPDCERCPLGEYAHNSE